MSIIEIRAFFRWRKVNLEQAYRFCCDFMKEIKTTSYRNERIVIINKSHLRGITFEELERKVLSYE